jgi:hypothetical protein
MSDQITDRTLQNILDFFGTWGVDVVVHPREDWAAYAVSLNVPVHFAIAINKLMDAKKQVKKGKK